MRYHFLEYRPLAPGAYGFVHVLEEEDTIEHVLQLRITRILKQYQINPDGMKSKGIAIRTFSEQMTAFISILKDVFATMPGYIYIFTHVRLLAFRRIKKRRTAIFMC